MVVEQKESDKNNDLKLDIFHPPFFPEANLEPLKTPEKNRSISPWKGWHCNGCKKRNGDNLAWQSEESDWVFGFSPWKLMAEVYPKQWMGPAWHRWLFWLEIWPFTVSMLGFLKFYSCFNNSIYPRIYPTQVFVGFYVGVKDHYCNLQLRSFSNKHGLVENGGIFERQVLVETHPFFTEP